MKRLGNFAQFGGWFVVQDLEPVPVDGVGAEVGGGDTLSIHDDLSEQRGELELVIDGLAVLVMDTDNQLWHVMVSGVKTRVKELLVDGDLQGIDALHDLGESQVFLCIWQHCLGDPLQVLQLATDCLGRNDFQVSFPMVQVKSSNLCGVAIVYEPDFDQVFVVDLCDVLNTGSVDYLVHIIPGHQPRSHLESAHILGSVFSQSQGLNIKRF